MGLGVEQQQQHRQGMAMAAGVLQGFSPLGGPPVGPGFSLLQPLPQQPRLLQQALLAVVQLQPLGQLQALR